MDNRIKRRRERRLRMIAFFEEPANKAIIDTQADVKADITTFIAASDAWEAKAVEIETLEENNNAAAKKAAMKAMAEIVTRWGQRCLVRLRRLGLTNEAQLANHQVTDFFAISGSAALDLAKSIRNMLDAHKSNLTTQGITDEVITEIDARIQAASDLETKPTAAIKNLEAKRTALIAADTALKLQLEEIVNTLHAEFRYTNTEFDLELMQQYELGGNTGHRYTALEGTAKNNQEPLVGYTVRRADAPAKKSVVNMEGAYHIKGMKAGEVTFELVDRQGVVKATKLLKLKLGTVVVWDWAL